MLKLTGIKIRFLFHIFIAFKFLVSALFKVFNRIPHSTRNIINDLKTIRRSAKKKSHVSTAGNMNSKSRIKTKPNRFVFVKMMQTDRKYSKRNPNNYWFQQVEICSTLPVLLIQLMREIRSCIHFLHGFAVSS